MSAPRAFTRGASATFSLGGAWMLFGIRHQQGESGAVRRIGWLGQQRDLRGQRVGRIGTRKRKHELATTNQ